MLSPKKNTAMLYKNMLGLRRKNVCHIGKTCDNRKNEAGCSFIYKRANHKANSRHYRKTEPVHIWSQ